MRDHSGLTYRRGSAGAVSRGDLPPRFVIKNAKVAHYSISGSTAEELRDEMKRKGPRGWHAYTDWNLSWNCRKVTVTCTVTLPSWNPEKQEPELQRKFRTYWNNLARHEQGHVDIVYSGWWRRTGSGCAPWTVSPRAWHGPKR